MTSEQTPNIKSLPWLKLVAFLVLAAIAAFMLTNFRQQQIHQLLIENEQWLRILVQQRPLLVYGCAFLIYVVVTAFSLPAATLMSLAMAFLFGFWPALILISFASTTGATLAFLMSRYFIGSTLQARFGDHLEKINASLEKEGPFYLFTLRLIPAVPLWLINLSMGLTSIPVRKFWWISQLGMLPATAVYVYAGSSVPQLSEIFELGIWAILKPQIIVAFVLLGIFPFVVRGVVSRVRQPA